MNNKSKGVAAASALIMLGALVLTGCTTATEIPTSNSNDGGGTTDGNPNGQVSEYDIPLFITPEIDNDKYNISVDTTVLDPQWAIEVDGVTGESAAVDGFRNLVLLNADGTCQASVSTLYQPSYYYGRGDLFLSKNSLYSDSISSTQQPTNERSIGIKSDGGAVEFRAITFAVDSLIYGEDVTAEPTKDGYNSVVEAYRIFDVLLPNGNVAQEGITQPFGSDPTQGLIGTAVVYQCHNAEVDEAVLANILDSLTIHGVTKP